MIYFLCGPVPRGNRVPVAFRVSSEIGQIIIQEYEMLSIPIVLSNRSYNQNPIYVTERVTTTLIQHGLRLQEIPARHLDYITRGAYNMRSLWAGRPQNVSMDNASFKEQAVKLLPNFLSYTVEL